MFLVLNSKNVTSGGMRTQMLDYHVTEHIPQGSTYIIYKQYVMQL